MDMLYEAGNMPPAAWEDAKPLRSHHRLKLHSRTAMTLLQEVYAANNSQEEEKKGLQGAHDNRACISKLLNCAARCLAVHTRWACRERFIAPGETQKADEGHATDRL